MTGNRAIKILEWAVGTLKWAGPEHLTAFERELLAKCNEIEISIPGCGKFPAIEVRNIIPKTRLVLEDGTYWEVESVHPIDKSLSEIVLEEIVHGREPKRQIIRKRHKSLMAQLKV